jgi:hypothetical protein
MFKMLTSTKKTNENETTELSDSVKNEYFDDNMVTITDEIMSKDVLTTMDNIINEKIQDENDKADDENSKVEDKHDEDEHEDDEDEEDEDDEDEDDEDEDEDDDDEDEDEDEDDEDEDDEYEEDDIYIISIDGTPYFYEETLKDARKMLQKIARKIYDNKKDLYNTCILEKNRDELHVINCIEFFIFSHNSILHTLNIEQVKRYKN